MLSQSHPANLITPIHDPQDVLESSVTWRLSAVHFDVTFNVSLSISFPDGWLPFQTCWRCSFSPLPTPFSRGDPCSRGSIWLIYLLLVLTFALTFHQTLHCHWSLGLCKNRPRTHPYTCYLTEKQSHCLFTQAHAWTLNIKKVTRACLHTWPAWPPLDFYWKYT